MGDKGEKFLEGTMSSTVPTDYVYPYVSSTLGSLVECAPTRKRESKLKSLVVVYRLDKDLQGFSDRVQK